jgi:hypothetical protein
VQRPGRIALELGFLALTVAAALPLWLVRWPPIQDLPQHLAAVRILADYDVPSLGFSEFFTVELLRTQYLAYYLAARGLAAFTSVLVANKLLVSASIIGAPYAMRALLRALGRDERPALFVLPLTWNAHLLLGFFNFIAAIPLCLVGLALAVRLRRAWSTPRALGLAAVALLTFYTHVVPFGFLGLGAGLIALGGDLRASMRRLLPLVPAGLAALLWMQTSPAGKVTATAAQLTDETSASPARFLGVAENLQQAPSWLTDVLRSDADDLILVAWMVLALACLSLASLDRNGSNYARGYAALSWRVAILGPLSVVLYFALPSSYDFIWPINARFALLAPLFLVPSMPSPRGLPGLLVFGAVVALTLFEADQVGEAFVRFERDEVGAFDEAIAVIPEGSRVAGLIFDRDSREVRFSPFLHSVAMLQAERGGAVMFSFTDFPQSPIRFREGHRPPPVRPRWEWTPERVSPRADLEWYEYVLVRGGPGAIASAPDAWRPVFEGSPWRVYQRVAPTDTVTP